MRKRLHDRLVRQLFLTGGAALGSAAMWHCSTSPAPEPTRTDEAALSRLPLASVLTQHNDNARTGANLVERTLTPQNVSTQFGYLYDLSANGVVYAQPLVDTNVTINGTVHASVVYVVS